MGTPDFAVGILKTIIAHNYDVVAVVTAADKPSGRGQKVTHSAVKTFALEHEIPLLQPTNLKSEEFLKELEYFQANLQVVVAFRMLPEVVWKMPALGTFNLHASLLPDYRGAAPINWAIINGETSTGVTTFFIDEKIDTGAILLKDELAIGPNETAGELHDRLMHLGSTTVVKTLELIQNNQAKTQLQPEADTKTAYKLNKDNCKIQWNQRTQEVYNHIRGLSPYPAAWTFLKDGEAAWNVKIYEANPIFEPHSLTPGTVITDHKKELKIATKEGYIEVLTLQFPGKKKMSTADLLNGIKLSESSYCS